MPGPYTSVAERLREVSGHLADRPAVVAADGDLTYRELQQHVDAVVRALAALPVVDGDGTRQPIGLLAEQGSASVVAMLGIMAAGDRKSTRLNSSHANISYAVFCLKKKK